ncbi:hypothetical protein Q1695_014534 [Nippostrongylus brasiliensis]|nr:hypothetical protein Q1695_014534 [Nippostrongylus brasiliensis]
MVEPNEMQKLTYYDQLQQDNLRVKELEEQLNHSNEEEQLSQENIGRYQEEVKLMTAELTTYPFRKREHRSPNMKPSTKWAFWGALGEHFSDCCPVITNGDERWEIINDELLCQHCLRPYHRENCTYKTKRCFYCDRVQNTSFANPIPFVCSHPTALCNIPDKKHIAEKRRNEMKKQLDR